jgi:hypothetical protein
MTYIPDGASEDYRYGEAPHYYAWGWLDSDYDYTEGWNDYNLKDRVLEEVNRLPRVDLYRGFHCDEELGLGYSDTEYPLNGSKKFMIEGKIYTAPAPVGYYIDELDYRPPDEVIQGLVSDYKQIIVRQDDFTKRSE